MKVIKAAQVTKSVIELVRRANFVLRKDVLLLLNKAFRLERNKQAKTILKAIIDNANFAKKNNLAICQDTGIPIIFAEIGGNLKIEGDLTLAVNKGIEQGYKKYSLRNSVVRDPLLRGKPGFSPAIIHTEFVKGDKLKLTILPKGFGCENKSAIKMFKPTAGIEEVKNFISDTVKNAGPDACPPYFVGVGIGGSADYASILAKKALLNNMENNSKFEQNLLKQLNKLGIGPMGLGGKASVLALKVLKYPTHIAGLPVSVNISCHALRSASVTI